MIRVPLSLRLLALLPTLSGCGIACTVINRTANLLTTPVRPGAVELPETRLDRTI